MAPITAFFRLDESISTGAQPTHSDLEWLAKQGFKAVLNTNTNTARNYLADEGEKLAALGVKYLHQPLDCSVLTPDKYDAFRDALKALLAEGGPVFVHCAGNVKVTGMMTPFRVLERNEPHEQVFADLARLPSLEPKWPAFWAKLGVPSAA